MRQLAEETPKYLEGHRKNGGEVGVEGGKKCTNADEAETRSDAKMSLFQEYSTGLGIARDMQEVPGGL